MDVMCTVLRERGGLKRDSRKVWEGGGRNIGK